MPVYVVNIKATSEATHTRLVEASGRLTAIAYAARMHITAEKATPRECVDLSKAGVEIEHADGEES